MKLILFLVVLKLALFCIYVAVMNRHSKNMSIRQKVLKAFYPGYMWFSKKLSKGNAVLSNNTSSPAVSFYSLKSTLINGQPFNFDTLKGKKILLVNTASDCAYTGQYEELEKLSNRYKGKLAVVGFPSNEFNQQEKADDSSIEKFCKMNFGVDFPMMKKSVVKKSNDQHKVYEWLTDSTKNGWNNKQPQWNFSKYLVNEEGRLVNIFAPAVSPLDKSVLGAIEK
jgi:glutathione peroxidase